MSKQPEALRLADHLEQIAEYDSDLQVATELRRLHEESLQWQDKCRTYIEIHDAVVKDNERLHEVNKELTKTLQTILNISLMNDGHWAKTIEAEAHAALTKAQGDNNG